MENAAPRPKTERGKTFMSKQEIMEKTALMKTKLDQASKEPKWTRLEKMYVLIMNGEEGVADEGADGMDGGQSIV